MIYTAFLVVTAVLVCMSVFCAIRAVRFGRLKRLNRSLTDEKAANAVLLEESAKQLNSLAVEAKKAMDLYLAEKKESKEVVGMAVQIETKFTELSKKYGEEVIHNENLKKEVLRWQEEAAKSLSQRKSSEVRVGKIGECFAGLLETFPYELEDCVFIGMPIDFIAFDESGVHIIEVKTGQADLTTKQRHIRDLIKDGKVSFEVFRINPEDKDVN